MPFKVNRTGNKLVYQKQFANLMATNKIQNKVSHIPLSDELQCEYIIRGSCSFLWQVVDFYKNVMQQYLIRTNTIVVVYLERV